MSEMLTTSERVEAGRYANDVYSLAVDDVAVETPAWRVHFWKRLYNFVKLHVEPEKPKAIEIVPMSDEDAMKFAEEKIPFGKWSGEEVWRIESQDPDYLAWLCDDGNKFCCDLRRYMARDKYKDD